MNGTLGKISVGLISLVPLAGFVFAVMNIAPRVNSGEISWFAMLAVAFPLLLVCLGLMVGLIVHVMRNPALGTTGRVARAVSLVFLVPLAAPVYWCFAALTGGERQAAVS